MKRFELSLMIGLAVSVLLSSFGVFGARAEEIRDNVVRLHILAHSDSEEDQALKLAVRDALLEETEGLFLASGDRREAELLAAEHLEEIEAIATRVVREQGYEYSVEALLVNMFFETRQYGDTTLAAGRYDAVRVVIGDGQGRNWWCVMFPPMCIPAASEKSELPLEEQIRDLGTGTRYQPKFAVVELVETIRDRLDGGGDRPAEGMEEA